MVDVVEGSSAKVKDYIKKHKYEYGICRIWRKSEGGQSNSKALGTGFLVQGLITPKCSFQTCLVTSDEVIAGHDFENYFLEFKKVKPASNGTKIELGEFASSDFYETSGLKVIGIDSNLIQRKRKKFYKEISFRLFNVITKRLESYEDLFCYFADDSEKVGMEQMTIEQKNRKEFYAKNALRTYSTFMQFTHGCPYGGAILKTIRNELIVVGVLQFNNKDTLSPVFFPISSSEGEGKMPPNHGATANENGGTTSKSGMLMKEQQDLGGNLTMGDGSNQGSTLGSKGIWWLLFYLKSWLTVWNNSDSCSGNGNSSLNLSGNCSYDITINPPKTPLEGGMPFYFSFLPDLPSDISSGKAKFLGRHKKFVPLSGLRKEADILFGKEIPRAEEEGSVTVIVMGRSDKTGEFTELGKTEIHYFDEREKFVKQVAKDQEQGRHYPN